MVSAARPKLLRLLSALLLNPQLSWLAGAQPKSPSPMRSLVEFSERFGSMLSRIFLTLLYFFVLGPFALLYRLAADPLRLRPRGDGNWATWVARNETLAAARRQD